MAEGGEGKVIEQSPPLANWRGVLRVRRRRPLVKDTERAELAIGEGTERACAGYSRGAPRDAPHPLTVTRAITSPSRTRSTVAIPSTTSPATV